MKGCVNLETEVKWVSSEIFKQQAHKIKLILHVCAIWILVNDYQVNNARMYLNLNLISRGELLLDMAGSMRLPNVFLFVCFSSPLLLRASRHCSLYLRSKTKDTKQLLFMLSFFSLSRGKLLTYLLIYHIYLRFAIFTFSTHSTFLCYLLMQFMEMLDSRSTGKSA